MAALFFSICVCILIAGWLWYYIARPILEDWAVISPYTPPRYDAETKRVVNDYQQGTPAPAADYVTTPAPAAPVPEQSVPVPVPVPARSIAELARSLTEDERLELMARATNARGEWAYSGKKLYALAGGNYGEFLEKMRRWRGENDSELPARVIPVSERGSEPRPLVMERPKRFYDDPELEYKAPA